MGNEDIVGDFGFRQDDGIAVKRGGLGNKINRLQVYRIEKPLKSHLALFYEVDDMAVRQISWDYARVRVELCLFMAVMEIEVARTVYPHGSRRNGHVADFTGLDV